LSQAQSQAPTDGIVRPSMQPSTAPLASSHHRTISPRTSAGKLKMKAKPLKLKGIKRVKAKRADGGIEEYYYHRASKKRLEGRPNTPEFIQSYAAADKAMRTRSRGTLSDLIRNFETSEFFKDLSPATKESYVPKFRIIDAKWGTIPIEATQDKEFRRDVLAWHEQLGKKSRSSADNLLVAMARVLSFAKREIRDRPERP
jgi:hypothetical protein